MSEEKDYADKLDKMLDELDKQEDSKKASNLKYNNKIKELKKQLKGHRNDRYQTVADFGDQQEVLDAKENKSAKKSK